MSLATVEELLTDAEREISALASRKPRRARKPKPAPYTQYYTVSWVARSMPSVVIWRFTSDDVPDGESPLGVATRVTNRPESELRMSRD